MLRLALTFTALTTAIALAAGCGNDGASSSDAASLAPAGALVYGEATLRPEGDQKAALDDLIEKFPGEGGAGERLGRLMEKAFAESDSGLSYEDDIEPWLGDEAAFFVSNAPSGDEEADGAFLVATEDEDATVDAVEKEGDTRKTDHRGHDLYISSSGDGAAAVLDGWLLAGTPGGVKAAIDTAEDGETLEDDETYQETLAEAAGDRLGFVYMNMPRVLRELEESPDAAALGPFRRMFGEPVLVTATANQDGVRLEGTVPATLASGFPFVAEGSGTADELPGDSWLALAQPDLGKTIAGYMDLAGGSFGSRELLRQQFKAMTGLDLERDVISWMGDWGVFVRGTSVAELEGAVFIETSDESASGRFIDAIARLARENAEPGMRISALQLPGGGEGITARGGDFDKPVHLFQRDGKVVAAYGDGAAQDALEPAETLADSPAFTQAEDSLGDDYAISFFLAIEPILALAESEGASEDEDWQEVKPYFEPLGALVGGAREDGDKLRSAFALTVK
jgi:Protein of unknown function (DUF3352)